MVACVPSAAQHVVFCCQGSVVGTSGSSGSGGSGIGGRGPG
jgi:hypothetical protein